MCLAFAKQAWTHRSISPALPSKACYVVFRPQTHKLCIRRINVYDWEQFRTPVNRKLCKICSSQSCTGREYCGWLHLLLRMLRPCVFLCSHHCRGCLGLDPTRTRHLECLPTSSQEQLDSLGVSRAPFHLFEVCCVSPTWWALSVAVTKSKGCRLERSAKLWQLARALDSNE